MFSVLGLFAVAAVQGATTTLATAPAEKMICKRTEEDTTGTRLAKTRRICRTQAEWRAMNDATARALNKSKNIGLAEPFAHEGTGR